MIFWSQLRRRREMVVKRCRGRVKEREETQRGGTSVKNCSCYCAFNSFPFFFFLLAFFFAENFFFCS